MQDNPNLLSYQYKTSPKIKKIYDGLFPVFKNSSPDDLKNFYNLEEASGAWLDVLGGIFNVPRMYSSLNDAFLLDTDRLDDPEITLDGLPGGISDGKYKALVKLFLFRSYKVFSIENIYEVLNVAFEPFSIDIIEGDHEMTIKLVFNDISKLRTFEALYSLDGYLLGKPMGAKIIWERELQ